MFLSRLFDEKNGAFQVLGSTLGATQGDAGGGVRLEVGVVDVTKTEPAIVFDRQGVTVTALGIPHGNLPTLAYRVQTRDVSVVFSSDQTGTNPRFVEFAKGANVLIMHLNIAAGATSPLHASPAVVGGTVYIGSWDSYLYAIDAETGQQKWAFKTGEDPAIHNQVGFQSSPAVVDGVVYVGCRDAHVYAIDALTGREKWDYPTSKSWVIGTPAVRNGIVYVGTSDSSRFMALDAKTGRLRFNFDAKSYMFSSPALAGDLAYVGDHNGRLYAINIKTGKLAWQFQTDAAKKDPFKILNADGKLNQESLYAPVFGDFEDMYLAMFKFMSIGAIVSSPVVDKGVVYLGSMDGNLYAVQ